MHTRASLSLLFSWCLLLGMGKKSKDENQQRKGKLQSDLMALRTLNVKLLVLSSERKLKPFGEVKRNEAITKNSLSVNLFKMKTRRVIKAETFCSPRQRIQHAKFIKGKEIKLNEDAISPSRGSLYRSRLFPSSPRNFLSPSFCLLFASFPLFYVIQSEFIKKFSCRLHKISS